MSIAIKIGKIITTHGLRGNVKVFAEVNQFEKLYQDGNVIDKNGNTIKPNLIRLTGKNNVYVIGITDVENIDQALELVGNELFTYRENIANNEEILVTDLADFEVFCINENEKHKIGHVHDIVNYGGGNMLEIFSDKLDRILPVVYPASFEFIESIDLASKSIVLKYDLTELG